MKTQQISQLKEHGFTVRKTSDMQTIVAHDEPFIVHGENGVYRVPLTEGEYKIVFAGMSSNGVVPYLIEQTAFPFLLDLQTKYTEQQRIVESQTESASRQTLKSVAFSKLKEGQHFFKDEVKSSAKYRKTGDSTYTKYSQLTEGFDLIAKAEMTVFVEYENIDIGLTPEQKQDIIANIPAGLSRFEFDETLGMMIEDIPGLEALGDEALEALHLELYDLYNKSPSHEDEELFSVTGIDSGMGVSGVANKMQAAKAARARGVDGPLSVDRVADDQMLSTWKQTLRTKIANHPLLMQTPSLRKKYERLVTNAKRSTMKKVEAQLLTDLNITSQGVIDGTV